jgi:purine-nucleoside/S-methyl-5'-thioadenosine phosphorylase / adenosine deaminase
LNTTIRSSAPVALVPLRSKMLSQIPFVRHGISRRVAGLGSADGNISYSTPRDREDAWRMRRLWAESIDIDANTLVTAHQVHGADVGLVSRKHTGIGSAPNSGLFGQADALISADSGVALMTTHADCLPIMICDLSAKGIGVVHAGWRGTILNVAGNTIRKMVEMFASDPSSIVAYLGPAICADCYLVGHEVVESWTTSGPAGPDPALVRRHEGWHFDLAAANACQLLDAGIRPDMIERAHICTQCGGPGWFSHRGQGASTGRFGAVIAMVG